MRVALAAVLFSRPDLLLLDEPTNYLDLEGALWLEAYLARYPHTVIIISHDRELLNRAVGGILHLEDKKLTYYAGPYDTFAATRAARVAAAEAENKKAEARRAHLQSFVDRFRYKASKAVQAQARLKMIDKINFIATPQEAALRRFSFPEPEELSPPIVNMESAAVGYGGAPVLSRLDLRIDQDDRIALLGKNGEGKSTLAKLIVGELAAMTERCCARRNCGSAISPSTRWTCCAATKPRWKRCAGSGPRKDRRGGAHGSRASGSMPTRRKRWWTSFRAGRRRA